MLPQKRQYFLQIYLTNVLLNHWIMLVIPSWDCEQADKGADFVSWIGDDMSSTGAEQAYSSVPHKYSWQWINFIFL